MKLATLKDGSRDGQLVVVSRDLTTAHYATGIAQRLQSVLDDWGFMSPQLQDLYDELNAGRTRHAFAFDPVQCMAPLPRATQCVQAAQPEGDAGARDDAHPALVQCTGDAFLGARDDIASASTALEIDFGAGLAVIAGDIARAASPEQALDGVRLLMLANTIILRAPERQERAEGHSPLVSRPAIAFGPVAVTPDELGSTWQQGRVQLTLQIGWNGRKFGLCDAAEGMPMGFGGLLAQLCRTRAVRAGSIVCSGPLQPCAARDGAADSTRGYASIAAKRHAEALRSHKSLADFLQAGDSVRLEVKGRDGTSVFGVMEQSVAVSEAGA